MSGACDDHGGWWQPDWPLPPGVGALMSTRHGGVSAAPFDSLNLKSGIGDDPAAVAINQDRHAGRCGALPVWLKQVHGSRVVRLDGAAGDGELEADAAVTTRPGLACSIQVADCLPVLFAADNGRGVGAAHAGWRGLAGGVLEATLQSLCEASGSTPGAVTAWLGPAIGPDAFEVGADVLAAFGASAGPVQPSHFRPKQDAATDVSKWFADLPGLARERLRACGVRAVHGNDASASWCTVSNASRFFSFRRDRVTGRLAASIWLKR